MSDKIGIGIIGCGMISAAHVRGYLDLPDEAQMLAVCDTISESAQKRAESIYAETARRSQEVKQQIKQAESAEEKEGLEARKALLDEYSKVEVKIYSDYKELLRDPAIDAVSVCTPPFVHEPVVIAAAEAGKHVFCEKPMARIATEARNMAEAAKKAGIKLGYQSGGTRLGATNAAIRHYVTSGKIGDVYYGRQTAFRVRGRPGLDMPNFSPWFLDSSKGGGGGIYDIGVYQVDRTLYLLGDPQPVTISGTAYRGAAPHYDGPGVYDVDEHVSVLVRFDNGMSFTFEDGWVNNLSGLQEGIFIFGSKGSFRGETLFVDEGAWDTNPDGSRRRYQAKLVEKPLELPEVPKRSKIGDFLHACVSDAQPISSADDGVKVMEILSGSLLSAKLGREITVSELYAIEGMRNEPVPGWPINP